MKAKGAHPHNRLTAVAVRKAGPGRHGDGNSLYLLVDDTGARRWVLRTVVAGRRRDIGLGSATLVPLAEARELARRYRKLAREGGDPVAERRRERRKVPTFEEAARTVHAEHKGTWSNPKHAAQWLATLEEYAFPTLGKLLVDQVQSPDIVAALAKIWTAKPETAKRVRQRIGTVLDWAKAKGHRDGENPVRGVGGGKGLPKANGDVAHHAALSYTEIPDFFAALRQQVGLAARALELTILGATRTSETLGATWSEIDLDAATWTIPAARMKAKVAHAIPLAPAAVALLRDVREKMAADATFVFPGAKGAKPLSNMAMTQTLRRMKRGDLTVHGFRSTFRDWCAERTPFPREIAEKALAHVLSSKVEAAYQRGDLFEKRRELMDAWSLFATEGREPK
jgi:integrase